LEDIDIRQYLGKDKINWLVCGGESGGNARSFDLNWARNLRDQCKEAGIPFFFKQTGAVPLGIKVKGKGGELDDIPEDLRIRKFPGE